MSSGLASLLVSGSFKKPGPSADFEKGKGGCYLKEVLILMSFFFEDKDPRFTRLKSDLALRLLSKGLFYIKAMDLESKTNLFILTWIVFFVVQIKVNHTGI